MSLETVASMSCVVSRWSVSLTATGRWPASFYFKDVSEALAVQETKEPGMLPSAVIQTTA